MVTGDYGGDSGYAEKKCYPTYETKYRKQCEDYNEKVCRTTHNEQCHDVTERVCDTAYDTELTEQDDFKCIHVPNTYCAMKDRTVYDKTCRTMINFDRVQKC